MKLYLQLSDVGSGTIRLHQSDPKAALLDYGQMVRFFYRGYERGGFYVENKDDSPVKAGDYADQWIDVAGRGPMRLLEDGRVWYSEQRVNVRQFTDMTLAGIIITLLTEARNRGVFPGLTWDFSDITDSNGDYWYNTFSLDIRVGTSLLDLMRQFASLGVDFFMGPDLKLRAFSQMGEDKSHVCVFRVGDNCQELTCKMQTAELKNAVLAEAQDGTYLTLNDLDSQDEYGRRETFFSAGQAPDITSTQRLAEAELYARREPKAVITVRVVDVDGITPRVFVDYNVGDWVGVDFGTGQTTPYRIRGLSIEWQDLYSASIELELNSLQIENEIRTAMKLNAIALGVGSSVSPTATPQNPSQELAQHNASATAHPNMVHDAVKLRGVNISVSAPGNGDALVYDDDDEQWEPRDLNGALVPAPHAESHAAGESDAIKLDDLGEPDDNTDLDATDDAHGLLPKLSGDTTEYLRGDGMWVNPASGVGGAGWKYPADGRLTLTTAVPLTTGDVMAATIVYYSPYVGDTIALFSGSEWAIIAFAEISIKLTDVQIGTLVNGNAVVTGLTDTSQFIVGMKVSGTGIQANSVIQSVDSPTQITLNNTATANGAQSLTFKVPADKNLDVFAFDSSGSLILEIYQWTADTTRATEIVRQNGIYVKSGATTRRYLGTLRTTGTDGQTEDSLLRRYCWNLYHQELRQAMVVDAAWSWTYNTETWRYWNGNNANKFQFVLGLDALVSLRAIGAVDSGSSLVVGISIGLDGTTPSSDGIRALSANTDFTPVFAEYAGYPGIGFHFLSLLEIAKSGVTSTFAGRGEVVTGRSSSTGAVGYLLG